MDMNTITANWDSSNTWSLFKYKGWQRYGYLLVCDYYVQSLTLALHCLEPTWFILCWKGQVVNATFVLNKPKKERKY